MDQRPRAVARRIGEAPALAVADLSEARDVRVTGVTHDSRAVRPGDLYVALPGASTHGARFCADAETAGAVAVLTDPGGLRIARPSCRLPCIVVDDPRAVLGDLSAWTYGNPAAEMIVIGITGTNGKTTTSFLLESGLSEAGHRVGVIGTTGIHVADRRLPSARTTPEAPELHALLALMREDGVTAVAIEVSSHALVLGRVDGLVFDIVLFTNLSRDHLDFHVSMEEYFAAKAALFTPARAKSAVVCVDDDWGRRLTTEPAIATTTFSIREAADWTLADVSVSSSGAWNGIAHGPAGQVVGLNSPMPGRFNRANALGSLACLTVSGIDPGVAAAGIGRCRGVPGRMEVVVSGEYAGIVDYAHTPDAVDRAIAAARECTDRRVLVALGCGGDRDEAKRAEMGRVAAAAADVLVVTDDNPRSEDPAAIRRAVLSGVESVPPETRSRTMEIADRRQAIAALVSQAEAGDVVLILGKGHEQGQEVAGVSYPFDDRQVLAREASAARSSG